MNVTRQPVEPGHGHRALLSGATGAGKGGGELRAAIKRACAFARLDFGELGDDLEPLGLGEPGDGAFIGDELLGRVLPTGE